MSALLQRAGVYLRAGAIDQALKDLKQHERGLVMRDEKIAKLHRKILRVRRRLCDLADALSDTNRRTMTT